MATLTVQGSGVTDNELTSNVPDTNYGTSTSIHIGKEYAGGAGTSIWRPVIKFDISSIPATATITGTVLTLTVLNEDSLNSRTISCYRVKRAWSESQSTWNSYTTGNAWQTAGASGANDREATNIGTATQGATLVEGNEVAITLTAAKIQEMINGVFTNNGFLLQVDTENADAVNYYSTNHATTTKRPKLVVDYTLPATSGFLAIL